MISAAARTYHEPCCWSEPDLDKVWKRAGMTPYASFWTTEGECHNRIMIKIRAMMARIFSYSGRHAKISLKFTDKQGFLSCLSVSKTHFTDKPASSNDLSVNFWPL